MARAMPQNQVLFDESIIALKRDLCRVYEHNQKSHSYLLFPFEVPSELAFGDFRISKTFRADFGFRSSFLSKVENPPWISDLLPHTFGIALSTLLSVIAMRDIRAPRDPLRTEPDFSISTRELYEFGVLHPIETAGPSSEITTLRDEEIERLKFEIDHIFSGIGKLTEKKYKSVMQSFRLLYLAIYSAKEDFGLAYFLAVSAIESAAQVAIQRDAVKKSRPNDAVWKAKAKEDLEFGEVYKKMKECEGKNQYIKERYIEFIDKYAPAHSWHNFVKNPIEHFAKHYGIHSIPQDPFRNRSFPSDEELMSNPENVKQLLSDSYAYRSNFAHRGEQPPHTSHSTLESSYFQIIYEYDVLVPNAKLVPNLHLMMAIARESILNWAGINPPK